MCNVFVFVVEVLHVDGLFATIIADLQIFPNLECASDRTLGVAIVDRGDTGTIFIYREMLNVLAITKAKRWFYKWSS